MSANVRLEWNGSDAEAKVRKAVLRRIRGASGILQGQAKVGMSISQPTTGAGRKKRGLSPSRPGEYPKKITGHERRNVMKEIDDLALEGREG